MFGNPRRTRVAVVIVGAANRSQCFHGIVVAPCAGYLLADRVQAERFVILALPSGWGDEGKARKGPPRVDEDAGPGEVAFQAWVASNGVAELSACPAGRMRRATTPR